MAQKSTDEKIDCKLNEIEKINNKIKNLITKKNILIKELKVLQAEKKSEEYRELEISLRDKGITLNELLENIKKKEINS